MKKLLVVVAVLSVAGFAAWRQWFRPEQRACAKLDSLCGWSEKSDRCPEQLGQLRGSLQPAPRDRFDACMAEANSCAQASGCLLGANANALGGAVNDFLQGLGKAVGK